MKKPKRSLTKEEYSSIVVIGCVVAGLIAMLGITITVDTVGIVGRILTAAFLIIAILLMLVVLIYQIKAYFREEDENK